MPIWLMDSDNMNSKSIMNNFGILIICFDINCKYKD